MAVLEGEPAYTRKAPEKDGGFVTSQADGARRPVVADNDLLQVIHRAFERAVALAVDITMPLGRQNAKRSQNWVTCLRNEFDAAYHEAGDKAVRAFCKACRDNKVDFGLNELLHDVCVCRVATVPSRTHNKPLMFVTDVLWQVESEFRSSGTEAIKDFNKLILGSAQNKLFVGPLTNDPDGDLAVLTEPAKHCTGEVYVAFIAHPKVWTSALPGKPPRLYRFDAARSAWPMVGGP